MLTIIVIAAVFLCVASLVGGVAILLRGDTGNAVEERLDVLAGSGGPRPRNGATAEPSLLAHPLDDVPNMLELYVSRFLNLRLFLEQAGSNFEPSKFVIICVGLSIGSSTLWLFTRFHAGFAPLVGICFAILPVLWLFVQRKRRLAAFAKQLPEALELISRALRAGHSLAAGLKLVADEMAEPIKREFTRCYEEQNFGIPLEESLEEMAERVPNLDLRFFVTAVVLQRQTGGDLAEILDKIGHLVRERFKIWGQVQALTGEGRLSGIVLLALPPVLAIVVYRLNPSYLMMLFEDPLGQRMLAVAVVMQLIGAFVIRKIVNIKV